jgi:glutathione S-transferase
MDLDLKARQILTLSEGILDAFVLSHFETVRGEGKISQPWLARQQRKMDGGIAAFEALAKSRQPGSSEYLVGDTYTIADIAVACTVTHIEWTAARPDWKEKYPELAAWWSKMEERETFKKTYPVMFDLKADTVV